MTNLLLIAGDLLAIALLAGSYFAKHGRKDMVLAYLVLNVGVLAVSLVLTGSGIGVGLGLGLFGVLSIIRLRSSELSQEEVAYYFAALALGLIFGLTPTPLWLAPALAALLLTVVSVVDHARLHAGARRQVVTLDRVIADEAALAAHLQTLLGGQVRQAVVQSTDLVRDSMVVDVRYSVDVPTARGRRGEERTGPAQETAPPQARTAGVHVPAGAVR